MHFIFVACNKNKERYMEDASFIYRCENLSYALKKAGHTSEMIHLKDFRYKQNIDVVIFHRPKFSMKLLLLLSYLRSKFVLTIYEVDDLVFDPEYTKLSPAYKHKILSYRQVKERFLKHFKALKLFTHFTVSTHALQNHVHRLLSKANVLILPNTVHYSWESMKQSSGTFTEKKLSYFPGTKSHDKDFEMITSVLTKFLNKYPEIILYITGPLEFTLDVNPRQIVHNKKVPFGEHWANYENVWVNLVPLEITEFTKCKSGVKILEAGFWSIPSIVTNTEEHRRLKNEGAFIANSEEEWFDILEKFLNKTFYYNKTKGIKEEIHQFSNIDNIAKKFITYCQKENFIKQKDMKMSLLLLRQIARLRRNKGLYDKQTLWLFRTIWLKTGNINSFVTYCSFRRDLGYPLTANKADFILSSFDDLSYISKQKVKMLLLEYSQEYNKKLKYEKENWLVYIRENQDIWEQLFITELTKTHEDKICIVGNSATLNRSNHGNEIDKHRFVIRFNNCWNDKSQDEDIGSKIDIWVSAPNYKNKVNTNVKWTIISGPNMIYKKANWNRFKNIQGSENYILMTPLDIWKDLVSRLNAPPSAGLLMLYWCRVILGDWKRINAVGFDRLLTQSNYHHVGTSHKRSNRHNWEKEKQLLKSWEQDGLHFLD